MLPTYFPFDAAVSLKSAEAAAIYFDEALKTKNAARISHALGVLINAQGFDIVVERTGLAREHLCQSCSASGNPTLRTLLAVLNALGIELTTRPAAAH